MSQDTARADAERLRACLLAAGVPGVSIEIQRGRGPAADPWHCRTFLAEMSHHTVSRPSSGATPCLALVKRGRPDVVGPLCNGYLGYDGIYRIITLGWANHPGAGGPLLVPGGVIPRNNARPYTWGTEFEGGIEPWTDQQRRWMASANAGILAWLGRDSASHLEHRTWAPTRKIDRLGYTADAGRCEIDALGPVAAPAPTTPADADAPAPSDTLIESDMFRTKYGSSVYFLVSLAGRQFLKVNATEYARSQLPVSQLDNTTIRRMKQAGFEEV